MSKYIDVDAFKKEMYHEAFETDTDMQRWDIGCWIRYKLFEKVLDKQPTADVRENKRGEWVRSDIYNMPYQCSVCGKSQFLSSDFCSHCGAEMRSTSTVSDTKG